MPTEGENVKPYQRENIALARKLRKHMTFPERELWYHFLKDYPIRFLRQKPIGAYIVDFYCAKAGLVIELDGVYHGIEMQMANDERRTEELQKMQLFVLRFQNRDVLDNFDGVVQEIDRIVRKRCAERAATPQSAHADSSPDKGSSSSHKL